MENITDSNVNFMGNLNIRNPLFTAADAGDLWFIFIGYRLNTVKYARPRSLSGTANRAWFPDSKSDTFWDIVMKLHTLTSHESRMRPTDFEVKRSTVKVMAHD